MRTYVERKCKLCSKVFKIHSCYAYYPNKGKFCSRKCQYESRSYDFYPKQNKGKKLATEG